MIQTLFYINGTQINPPKNWMELGIELNYGKDQFPQGNTVSITDFDWVRENFDFFDNYIAQGLTGGVGIFEAPPFRIDVYNGKKTKTVFDGYIDLTDNLRMKDRIRLTAKAVSHATVDWINQVANGFSFEYLASLPSTAKGAITPDDYRFMPYVNNSVPNYEQAAIATLMVYNITQAIIKEIEEIVGIVSEAAGYFTTIPAIIKLIVKIAYLIVLIITLIKLVEDMIKFLVSPVKYHAGMYVRDLMAKGCEYLGMTFKSDIWEASSPYYNEFILPEKFYNAPSKKDKQILGFIAPDKNEQIGYYKGTFGQLLDAMKTKYNAKIIISGNQVMLMRKDKNAKPPSYQLPDIYMPEFTYNTDELQANTLIEFRTDGQDTNTFQDYAGTIYQVICQPKVVNNQAFVMMKNLTSVDIPFARASVKTDLTIPEKIFDFFLTIFEAIGNALIAVINVVILVVNTILAIVKKIFKFFGITINIKPIPKLKKLDLASTIDNRKGMLMLSNDHFNVAKIFILKEGSQPKYNKIDSTNSYFEHAKAHWDNFYYVNSFIPKQLNPAYSDRPTGNQFKIKEFPSVPFTWDNFLSVFTNNRIYDANGNVAILESLRFNPHKELASMKVRFSQIYTLNLQETFLNPTGQ
jgi:hypothetical protein